MNDKPLYYGDKLTYQLGAGFLADCKTVEDWGTGGGAFKTFRPDAIGVDGSKTPFADKTADLQKYVSNCEGVFMRHILEHNYNWQKILTNAIKSASKKICIVFFIPLSQSETKEIAFNKIGVPDLSISESEFNIILHKNKVTAYTTEHATNTQYSFEKIFYIKK